MFQKLNSFLHSSKQKVAVSVLEQLKAFFSGYKNDFSNDAKKFGWMAAVLKFNVNGKTILVSNGWNFSFFC